MKTYQTSEIRNVAITGNSGSGKTTFAEAMLLEGKVIDRKGDIDSKTTVSDYREIEHERLASVYPALLYTEWNNKKINFIDTPGMDDFVGGVVSSLHVADSTLMLINAQNGVEVGTEIQARHLDKLNIPIVFAMNQLDHDKANFESAIESMKTSFGNNVILAQYPVNPGQGFNQVIDLITQKMLTFKENGGAPEVSDIPDSEKDKAEELYNELIEKAAENDDALMETFFENGTLTEEEMLKGIKVGVASRGMFPVFCISAKHNMGTTRVLDFIAASAPAPDEVEAWKDVEGNEVKIDANDKTSIFVFRTSVESHIGEVVYFKVISGKVTEAMDLVNSKNRGKERISGLYVSAGKKREKVTEMLAGDLGATVKMKSTKVNQTLSDCGREFPAISFPEPKFRTAIKALSEGDEEKLGEALNRIHDEDPTVVVEISKELRQTIVSGQGEYHLQMLKWNLDNIFKIEAEFIAPRIPYRETITRPAQADYRHKKQSGGSGQFGEVHMIIEPVTEGMSEPSKYKVNGKELGVTVRGKDEHPLPWGGVLQFYNCIVGGSIDTRFHPAILKGIMEKMEMGPLTGSYARDIRVCIYDGKMHPVDSNEISFKLAGRNAFSTAFKNAGPKILEPVYLVEVWVPADRMGDVMSDLQTRRAMVQGMSSEKGFEKITAKVPLAEMNKYSTSLSSITGGRAIYQMSFDEYAAVPSDVQEKLLKEYEEEQNED